MSRDIPDGADFPLKVIYEYEVDENCPRVPAHGVWGGVSPHGEIEMNIYSESDKLPQFSERLVHPDGTVSDESSSMDEQQSKTIVRRVHVKIYLNYHTARAVMDWLEEKVQALEMEGMDPFPEGGQNGPAQ